MYFLSDGNIFDRIKLLVCRSEIMKQSLVSWIKIIISRTYLKRNCEIVCLPLKCGDGGFLSTNVAKFTNVILMTNVVISN